MQKEMQTVSEVMKTMGTRLTWGSNKCVKHEHYPDGVLTIVDKGIEKCPICERERLNKQMEQEYSVQAIEIERNKKHNKLYHRSILQDKTLIDSRFDNYRTDEPEAKRNYEAMKMYADEIINGKVFNILLYGTPGVGKSHLSYALLHYVNEAEPKNRSCLFVDIDEMLRKIRDSFNNPESIYTEFYFTELLSNVDVLVLDDLGAETGNEKTDKQASDFTGRILRAVMNARQDKVTILTTNLPGTQLKKMYDDKTLSRLSKKRKAVTFKETTDKRTLDLGF